MKETEYIRWGWMREELKKAAKFELDMSLESRRMKNMVAVSLHERCAGFCNQIIEALDARPAEDVAPVKRGTWVKVNESLLDGNFRCSNCGEVVDIATGEETPLDRGMKYCCNCGADLRLHRVTSK